MFPAISPAKPTRVASSFVSVARCRRSALIRSMAAVNGLISATLSPYWISAWPVLMLSTVRWTSVTAR